MTTQATSARDPSRVAGDAFRPLDTLAKRAVLDKLTQLHGGQLVLVDGGERYRFGTVSEELAEPVVVHVHDRRFYGDLALGGSVGAGEAYMQGYWVGSSRVDLQACKLEYSIVSPK